MKRTTKHRWLLYSPSQAIRGRDLPGYFSADYGWVDRRAASEFDDLQKKSLKLPT